MLNVYMQIFFSSSLLDNPAEGISVCSHFVEVKTDAQVLAEGSRVCTEESQSPVGPLLPCSLELTSKTRAGRKLTRFMCEPLAHSPRWRL